MSYQVLARKWRPRSFREMVGQTHVLKALINALDNQRLHHAYLFTGTRGVGKTTTTMLTYTLLKNAGLDVGLAGNIGNSFALQVARDPHACYVLEISSFMLDDMYHFRADVAVILNITPDHLDRYDYKMGNYVASKFRMLQNQRETDYFIYCLDDPETVAALDRHPTKAIHLPFTQDQALTQGAFVDAENNLNILVPNREVFTMNIVKITTQIVVIFNCIKPLYPE